MKRTLTFLLAFTATTAVLSAADTIKFGEFASLTGKPMSIETAENLLRDVLHEESRFTLTIEVIQKRVAEHFDLRLADMTSKRRPENIAFPRQIAMFLSRQMTESSLNALTQGEKTAPETKPGPRIDKVAPETHTQPLPPLAEAKKDAPTPPPPWTFPTGWPAISPNSAPRRGSAR